MGTGALRRELRMAAEMGINPDLMLRQQKSAHTLAQDLELGSLLAKTVLVRSKRYWMIDSMEDVDAENSFQLTTVIPPLGPMRIVTGSMINTTSREDRFSCMTSARPLQRPRQSSTWAIRLRSSWRCWMTLGALVLCGSIGMFCVISHLSDLASTIRSAVITYQSVHGIDTTENHCPSTSASTLHPRTSNTSRTSKRWPTSHSLLKTSHSTDTTRI